MNLKVIHDIVLDATPIPIAAELLRKQYASMFRCEAATWRLTLTNESQMSNVDYIKEGRQWDSSGSLMIAAYQAGVLPDVGGLHALLAEYTKPEEPEKEPLGYGRARLTRCPVNLFLDFAGGNRIPVLNDGGVIKRTGPRCSGLAPRLVPGLLGRPRHEQYAAVCELLADLIESQASIDPPSHQAASSTLAAIPWEPPDGFVGTKTITSDPRFRKHGKNPPRTTIDQWYQDAVKRGEPPERHYAPDSREVYLPLRWVTERIASWHPRQRKPRT